MNYDGDACIYIEKNPEYSLGIVQFDIVPLKDEINSYFLIVPI